MENRKQVDDPLNDRVKMVTEKANAYLKALISRDPEAMDKAYAEWWQLTGGDQ